MFELSLLCPEERVEPVSEALEALDALSVSVEDADAQTDAEQALFGEPGMPPPKEGWQRSRVTGAVPRRSRRPPKHRSCWQAQDFFAGCKVLGVSPVPDQDWVRLTQSQFAPVEITPEFWIVPTWHEPPAAGPAGHPARPRPGLRHRHPSDHPHVPALDRAASAARPARAGLRLRLGHPGDRRGQLRRARPSTRWTSTPPPCSRPGQCPGQRRAAPDRPARTGAGQIRTGAGQHPGHAARRCWRRCCARMWRRAAGWCWRASWSARRMN